MSETEGQLQDYSVDQLGGFVVMVAGAIGSLLLVVWQSKCHCRMNLCYIFQCERRPPSEEEMKSLKMMKDILKQKYQELQAYLSEYLIKYIIVESVLERAISNQLDRLVQEKKLVVILSKEK